MDQRQDMSRPAVGAVLTPEPRGTAFAVTDRLLLTCWHCLADPRDRTKLRSERVVLRLAPDVLVEGVYSDHDPRLDVALLELDPETPLPPGWRPVPLGRHAQAAGETRVVGLGWPTHNPSTVEPQSLPARVAVRRTTIHDGMPVIQLFSDEVAARMRPRGFSGGPVLVDTVTGQVAVGVICWMQEDDEDEGRAVGGTVYAVPVAEIIQRWPELGASLDAVDELAGDVDAPGRGQIANFIDTHLRGSQGTLPFAGRAAELDTLDAWLADPDAPPYHLVCGEAGAGKSTLLVRWATAVAAGQPWVRPVFVPVSLRYEATGAGEVFTNLLHRVARVHGVGYDYNAGEARARDALAALLSRPAPDGGTLLVIVDALDEAGWEPGPADFPRRPGPGVRIVLSARHTARRPSAEAWAEALNLPDTAVTRLGALCADDVAELLRQVRPQDPVDDIAPALWRLTRGDPVTTGLYLRDLADRPLVDLAALERAAPGLDGYFAMWEEEQERQWRARDAKRLKDGRRLLNLLAVAEGPVRLTELRSLAPRVGKALDADRLRQAVRLLDRLVLPGREPDSFLIAHPLITRMLRKRLDGDGDLAAYREAYVAWGREVMDALLARELSPTAVPTYLARHLAAHLVPDEAGAGVPMREAFALTHGLWRRARETGSDELDGYRADVRRVAARARAANQRAFEAGERLPYLPEQILCAAALAGERAALGTEMSHHLAAQLVRYGIWPPGRALSLLASEVFDSTRAHGLRSLAPYLGEEHLPALRQILEKSVDAFPEYLAPASAAYARRLLELGRVEDALAVAEWLPDDHRYRGLVHVWVVSELAPLLPAPLAERILIDAMDAVGVMDTFAACWLTKQVPVGLAESAGIRDRLVSAMQSRFDPGWRIGAEAFVAAARWLSRDVVDGVFQDVLFGPVTLDQQYELMPSLHHDGLFSVLPAEHAAHAAARVVAELDYTKRVVCLMQLLPLLEGDERERYAEVAFEQPELLRHLQMVELDVVCPALAAAGYAGRALRAVGAEDKDRLWTWLMAMWRYLTREETELALSITVHDAEDSVPDRPPRKWALARLAAFGPEEAGRALDLVYDQTDRQGLAPTLVWQLATYLPEGSLEPNQRASYREPWWERCTYPGAWRSWESGVRRYPNQVGQVLGDEPLDMLYAAATDMDEDDVPHLMALADAQPDPWVRLTVLAAGTHPPHPTVMEAIMAGLRRLRDEVVDESAYDGYPAQCPWLVRGIGDWTPFFVRLLSPAAAETVKPLLFEGGYLDGVARLHHSPFGSDHKRLDDWAHDVLALMPILSVAEIDALLELRGGDPGIKSESTRKAFEAAAASALAGLGEVERAYTLASWLGWQTQLIRSSAMADILPQLPTEGLLEWAAEVHRYFDDAKDRGQLWAVFHDRWAELGREEMWRAVDRWTTELPLDSRGGVIADILFYRSAIARLGGHAEAVRILDLLGVAR
ncbi:trypsin-like peptidase domain-containing protein [Nonomuraea sp. NBC_00507]|uniref:trypsin-like peptidase domain-containing protein n=1 Tax=Nonomuraea sp. NBC_00507 TaxID=2976002 RepID=UPI002E1773E2